MPNRILQFGTSRFLQAHADLFVHEARVQGQDIGPITIVKTTNTDSRANRVGGFNSAAGFPVRLKGFRNGQLIDETTYVKSVTRALDANSEWEQVKKIFAEETEIVFSNVGETGYALSTENENSLGAPKSFPAKFLALLLHRYHNGAKPLLVLPCELVSNNGNVLKQLILNLAPDNGGFKTWMKNSVLFCDTLVDRIVSEAIEPVGAIGEPYGLWAIERQPGMIEPIQHPCITYTNNLEPYLRLKLHILNLGHTYLAEIWQKENRPSDETIRAILQDAGVKQRLKTLYNQEVLPGFAAQAMEQEAANYMRTTLERFENPFLNHRLSDITQNHSFKIERRMADFIKWARAKSPDLKFNVLETLVSTHRPNLGDPRF
jgi:tagaturonate reductase